MISLNAVTLSDDLLWINRYNEPSAILSPNRAISGSSIIQKAQLQNGKTLVLSSVEASSGHSGWWTKLQLEGIRVLEASGEVVTFIYESESFQVIVLPGTINMEPLIERPNSADDDNFVGSISLITI